MKLRSFPTLQRLPSALRVLRVLAYLADEPSADIVAYFRHGASKTHIVECLRALLKRAEEDLQ